MRFTPSFCFVLLLLVAAACGGGGGGVPFDPVADPVLTASCVNGTSVIMETDEQAYLQFGGAFDQLRHDEGPGNAPVKMTTKIDHFVKQYMCENDIAGLGLGIVWQGNLVYVKGYGLARGYSTPGVGDDVPVRGQRTRFRWASVSKCLTGVASVIATRKRMLRASPIWTWTRTSRRTTGA